VEARPDVPEEEGLREAVLRETVLRETVLREAVQPKAPPLERIVPVRSLRPKPKEKIPG
jgi:hypothetical protein